MPLYASPTSSAGTRVANSYITSYCSSPPSTHTNTFIRRPDTENNKHDSSTTIYSSSHQSDSLYNEPTKRHAAKIVTTSFNHRMKKMHSPSYNRKATRTSSIHQDQDDQVPRQILLPIGGGIVGKLASSATNISYHDSCLQPSPKHRNPSGSVIHDEMIDPYIIRTRL
ncbi:unnamed protein product [Rotaria magnacalcarata]|nr:unnamed protein product [Rotaria magnacalcarata]